MLLDFARKLAWPTVCGVLLGLCILMYLGAKQNQDFSYAVAKAAPAVANIYTTKIVQQRHPLANDPLFKHFFNRSGRAKQQLERSLGSGVIVSNDGYLLTNYHVIEGADEILVLLQDGRQALASVIGSDADTDLAVLKIDLENLISIKVAEPDSVTVGNIVLAIGNPYGFGQTVTQGIVSATGRYGLGLSQYENFIQTDAAINPGNSGGALIDTKGRLLGINTAIYTQSGGSTGIGLAIPTDLALRTMNDLIRYGRPLRGWLGLEVQPLATGTNGVVITGLAVEGPAAKAGLRVGDILTDINGKLVGDGHAGMKLITYTRPGETVRIGFLRNDTPMTVTTDVAARPNT
ncbi:trypsin-like peptidase domain-containing protein [Spongiibacter taiwanensis]|uniref:S1C family serine protease n=1 Tax=Spongiibacter taiwanensis TaxID=1748242 RepID=UPI002034C08D|nr:trypsin-like peptidase domain-containing protein [Spongiibacter taiwanensis]USA44298.1 trypsin-like peptidase domain-containing protein [Spongiibacter taiwanensis]